MDAPRRADTGPPPAATELDIEPWVRLQRWVAGGMLATFAAVMLAVAGTFLLPLAVAGAAVGLLLVLSWRRPRGAAIGIGIFCGFWLLSQAANADRVLPDLTEPAAVAPFTVTVAMLLISAAGLVGLIGLLRGHSGVGATRILQVTGAGIALAWLAGTSANLLMDDGRDELSSDAPNRVLVRDDDFDPVDIEVTAGTAVTWEWVDSDVRHDVVGESFDSELIARGSFAHTFQTPGDHPYRCTLHPEMRGTVSVVEDDETAGDADKARPGAEGDE